MFNCEVCNVGPIENGIGVLRVNKPGEMPARWRCRTCITPEQMAQHDANMVEILDIIEADNKSK